MEEKQICCCGSSGWTRVIGWFQLVFSILGIIGSVVLLIGAVAITPEQYEKAFGRPLSAGERQNLGLASTITAVTAGLYLLMLVVSLVMSIFLLKGTYNRNPRYLHAWITYTVVFLVLGLIISIVKCFYSGSGAALGSTIFSILWMLLVQGFCIWVVNTHKNEMLNGQAPVHPVKA